VKHTERGPNAVENCPRKCKIPRVHFFDLGTCNTLSCELYETIVKINRREKYCGKIVFPRCRYPQQIGNDQAYAEDRSGTAHPANLCGKNGQHEDYPADAITRCHCGYPTRHSASSQPYACALLGCRRDLVWRVPLLTRRLPLFAYKMKSTSGESANRSCTEMPSASNYMSPRVFYLN